MRLIISECNLKQIMSSIVIIAFSIMDVGCQFVRFLRVYYLSLVFIKRNTRRRCRLYSVPVRRMTDYILIEMLCSLNWQNAV